MVGVSHRVLEAISAGAMFMGAGSYIGNGPDFMVRSIAEARGVRMPGFFGYLACSGAVLVPVLVIVTVVFFERTEDGRWREPELQQLPIGNQQCLVRESVDHVVHAELVGFVRFGERTEATA